MNEINVWAILAAAVACFLVGGVWYSPILFLKPWMEGCKLTEAELNAGNMGKIFGGAFVLSLLMAANLAAFLADPKTDMAWGATAGFLAGFGWASLGLGVLYLFERRPLRLWLVNAGYLTVSFVLMGAILGAWR